MTPSPTILVLVGITGDLSRRKLLPALETLARYHLLPEHFRVVGITRRAGMSVGDIIDESSYPFLSEHVELFQMDLENSADYQKLGAHLKDIEHSFGSPAEHLWYLSVAPSVSDPIIKHMGTADLIHIATTILLEKPFGIDLQSAQELAAHVAFYTHTGAVRRIDHYLAKQAVQHIISLRQSIPDLEKVWNNASIARIEVIATESIDIEGRTSFYEQTGAVRDLIQSHLLEVLSLVLMELPSVGDTIPVKRLQALQALSIPQGEIGTHVVRGQYEGYRTEVGVPDSMTETYASITAQSSDPRWNAVPLTLITGKAMNEKKTEVRLYFKEGITKDNAPLIIHIQPEGTAIIPVIHGMELVDTWNKEGGTPDSYELVFHAALQDIKDIFVQPEEIFETWRIIDPVLTYWKNHPDTIRIYKKGAMLQDLQ